MSKLDKTDDVTMDMEAFRDFGISIDKLNGKEMVTVVLVVPLDGGSPSCFSNQTPGMMHSLLQFVVDHNDSALAVEHKLDMPIPDNEIN